MLLILAVLTGFGFREILHTFGNKPSAELLLFCRDFASRWVRITLKEALPCFYAE